MSNVVTISKKEFRIWGCIVILALIFGAAGFIYGTHKREGYVNLYENMYKSREDLSNCIMNRKVDQENKYVAWRKVKELENKAIDCELSNLCSKFIEESAKLNKKR